MSATPTPDKLERYRELREQYLVAVRADDVIEIARLADECDQIWYEMTEEERAVLDGWA